MGRICEVAQLPRGSEFAAVFIFAVVLYVNSVFGEFVFDDHEAVQQNADVRLDTSLAQVFSDDFWGNSLSDPESHQSYRPLTVLTFRWNRQLHGMQPAGFHVVNILLHAVVCLLLLGVFRCSGVNHTTSLVATFLFAAHPIHTEAVANIAGRAELLSAVTFLFSILTYQQFLRAPISKLANPPCCSLIWLLLSIALGGVAMLCKEQGITCIGVNLVLHLLAVCEGDLRRLVLVKLWWRPAIMLTTGGFVLLGIRLILIGGGIPSFVDSDNPASFSSHFLTRLLTYAFLCPVNFWMLLCPSRLCFDWSMGSIPLVEEIRDGRNLTTLGFFACLVFLALWSVVPSTQRNTGRRREKSQLIFAMALVVLPFLPASNLLFPVGFVVAERVLYLPSMGSCLMVAIATSRILQATSKDKVHQYPPIHPTAHINKGQKTCRKLVFVAVALLLFVFSAKTLVRNTEWQDTHSLAASALGTNPANAKVHFTMGNVLAQQGNRMCEAHYREAIRLRPNYTLSWTNLGLVLLNTERPQEAESCYRRALSIKHDHVTANTNMGHLCRLQGRWKEAIKHYRVATRRRPNNPVLHYHIGNALMHLSDDQLKEAEEELSRAVDLHPGYPEAHLALGKLLAMGHMGSHSAPMARSQVRKAIVHIRTSLPYLKDPDPEVYLLLGKLLITDNQPSEAEKVLGRVDSNDKKLQEEVAKIKESKWGKAT